MGTEISTIVSLDYGIPAFELVFKPYKTEVDKYSASIPLIKVDDAGKLEIAKQQVVQLNDIKKAIKNLHEEKKKPAKIFVDNIDSVKKGIDTEIDRLISLLKTRIISYQEVQAAAAKLKAEEDLRLLNEKKVKVEIDRKEIVRLSGKMTALIFGGSYYDPDGSMVLSIAAKTEKELLQFRNIFQNKLPVKEMFVEELRGSYLDIINNAITMIDKQILEVNKPVLITPDDVPELVIPVTQTMNSILSKMEAASDKSLKKEENKIGFAVKTAGKGLTVSMEFNVVNEELIPREYLEISKSKIDAYLSANKETILDKLEKGTSNYEIIQGLHVTGVNKVSVR
jgi:hypothetical protein